MRLENVVNQIPVTVLHVMNVKVLMDVRFGDKEYFIAENIEELTWPESENKFVTKDGQWTFTLFTRRGRKNIPTKYHLHSDANR